jgi:hypothetical protein
VALNWSPPSWIKTMTGRFSLVCCAAVQTLSVKQSSFCGPEAKPGEKPQQLRPN